MWWKFVKELGDDDRSKLSDVAQDTDRDTQSSSMRGASRRGEGHSAISETAPAQPRVVGPAMPKASKDIWE